MDDQLKQQLKEFGEAVNNALFDSKQLARAVARIEEAGYESSSTSNPPSGLANWVKAHVNGASSLLSCVSTPIPPQ